MSSDPQASTATAPTNGAGAPVLSVRDLVKNFPIRSKRLGKFLTK